MVCITRAGLSLLYDAAGRVTSLGLGLTGSTPIIQRSYTYHAWNEDINGGLLESLTAVND